MVFITYGFDYSSYSRWYFELMLLLIYCVFVVLIYSQTQKKPILQALRSCLHCAMYSRISMEIVSNFGSVFALVNRLALQLLILTRHVRPMNELVLVNISNSKCVAIWKCVDMHLSVQSYSHLSEREREREKVSFCQAFVIVTLAYWVEIMANK